MDALDPSSLGLEFGGGAAIGLVMGFAAKKVAKLLAIVVGLQLIVFRYLESREIIVVNWDALSAGLVSAGERADPSYLESVLSTATVGAGFTAGFLLGFRRG